MRTVALPLLFLALVCSARAQTTTYTTTQDACSGKANQACFNIPVTDQNGTAGVISIDNRASFRVGYLDLGPYGVNEYHGVYSGFVGNPNGTHSPFSGVASYESDDGTVVGQFYFNATYVSTCSGRACGGTLGWHYRILAGSSVTVN